MTIINIITANTQDWCDCGAGTQWVDVWDPNDPDDKHRINTAKPETIIWPNYVLKVNWQCDGQSTIGTTAIDSNTKEWYVDLHSENKVACLSFGGTNSGRLAWGSPGKL